MLETYLEEWEGKRYKRHVQTWTTEIASQTLPPFSAVNGDNPIIWNQTFQKLALWLYDLRLVAYILEMKRIDDLSQERICSLWNWVRKNLSLRVFVRRVTDERFFPDADRVTMTKCSVNKKKNHDRYKKDDPNDEDLDTTRDDPTQLSWRELYCHRNARRRRPRHVVCRCGNCTEVFDDFRRHVSVSFVTSRTLHKDLRHWRRRNFVRHFSFDGWHFLYLHSSWKRDTLSSKENRKDFDHIFNVFLSQLFLCIRSCGNALRRCIWTSSFRCIGAKTYTLLPGIGSRFFCFIVFSHIPVREMIAKTLMCITLFSSLCIYRRLRWKNSVKTVGFSFCAFGMKKISLIW